MNWRDYDAKCEAALSKRGWYYDGHGTLICVRGSEMEIPERVIEANDAYWAKMVQAEIS